MDSEDNSQVPSEQIKERAADDLKGQGTEISQGSSESVAALSSNGATPTPFNPRVEVSASTVARMMGIASATDLQLLEGRLDLIASRVSTLMTKVDKVLVGLGGLASTGDIARIETQVASVRSQLREAVDSIRATQDAAKTGDRQSSEAQSRRLKEGIQSSSE